MDNFSLVDTISIVFIVIVTIISYFRGFFKTLLTIIKVPLALGAAYLGACLLGNSVGGLLPDSALGSLNSLLLLPEIKKLAITGTKGLIGGFIVFIAFFILAYILLSIFGVKVVKTVKKHQALKITDKVFGSILGCILGILLVWLGCYIISTIILIQNMSTPIKALATIDKSYFLKFFTENNAIAAKDYIINLISNYKK